MQSTTQWWDTPTLPMRNISYDNNFLAALLIQNRCQVKMITHSLLLLIIPNTAGFDNPNTLAIIC